MMKKRVLAGVLSAAMAVSMSFTMAYAGETETVSGTEAAANADGLATEGKFVVGFDAEYPPYGYMDDNGETMAITRALTWNWHRRSVIWKAGSWSRHRLTGTPRIWNSTPVTSTVSGTASR